MNMIMPGPWPEPSISRRHYELGNFLFSLNMVSWYVEEFGPGLAFSSEYFRQPSGFMRCMLYDLHLSLQESAQCMNLLEHMKLEDLHRLICHHKGYVLPMTKNAYVSSHFQGCSGNFFYLATFFFHCYNWDPWRTNFVKFSILYCDYLDYI